MNNAFHDRLIDIKVELGRIPQATASAIGKALAESKTVAEVIASAQETSHLRGELCRVQADVEQLRKRMTEKEEAPEDVQARLDALEAGLSARIDALGNEHEKLSRSFKCLIGLSELGDCIDNWQHSKSQVEHVAAVRKALDETILQAVGHDASCRDAWHQLGEEYAKNMSDERRAQLQAFRRKLQWAVLSQC
jgi:hypothetical protein